MKAQKQREFTSYGTSDVQAFFAERPDPQELSDQDLFFILRNERVLSDRALWKTYLAEMKRRVDAYNATEPKYKTPYPLRYEILPPGLERTAIILNINTLDDSFGCPNMCSWCGINAPRAKAEDIIYMPFEQQMHLMDEIAETARQVVGDHEQKENLVRGALNIGRWEMADPLSHPDVIKKIITLYEMYGLKPDMPTALPAHATETARQIYEAAASQQETKLWKNPRGLEEFGKLVELRKSLEFCSGNDDTEGTSTIGLKLGDIEKKLKELTEASRYGATLHIWYSFLQSQHEIGAVDKEEYTTEPTIDRDGENLPSIRDALTYFKLDENVRSYLGNPYRLAQSATKFMRLYGLSKDAKTKDFDIQGTVAKCRSIVENALGKKIEEIDLTNDTLTDLTRKLQPEIPELARVPELRNNISISHTKANQDRIARLDEQYGKALQKLQRDFDPQWKPDEMGVHYFGTDVTSGNNRTSTAWMNKNGLSLTPIGLLNTISTIATYENQCGQIEAPYKGLRKDTPILNQGENLTRVSSEVIIILGKDPRGGNGSLLILDGNSRLRLIKYDAGQIDSKDPTYTYQPGRIIDDTVIAENVTRIDAETFKFRGALMEECKTCPNPCFGLVPHALSPNDF